MSEQKNDVVQKPAPSAPIRNPYIMNFLKALVEKKGEQHQTDDLKKLLGDMYRLFECMLGQNMVNALPEDVRKQYLAMGMICQIWTTKKLAPFSIQTSRIT